MPRTPSVPNQRRMAAPSPHHDPSHVQILVRHVEIRESFALGRSMERDQALAELRRLARLVQAGFLALDLACIPCEEAFPLERHPKLGIRLDQCPCDPVSHGACLAADPAAVDAYAQVVATLRVGDLERRERECPVRRTRGSSPRASVR